MDATLCHAEGKRQDTHGIGMKLQAFRLHLHEVSWRLHNWSLQWGLKYTEEKLGESDVLI